MYSVNPFDLTYKIVHIYRVYVLCVKCEMVEPLLKRGVRSFFVSTFVRDHPLAILT